MKHLRKFEKYTINRKKEEIIKESVLQVNDIYKVRTFIDIPQSLINAYVKKVKDTTGKNLRQFFGDVDIAEEVVKYINMNFLNVDQIPAGALMGDGQSQSESQPQAEPQAQPHAEPQAQPQAEPQAQPQAQPQAEPQAEPQAQSQVQVQAEAEPQGETQKEEFEEVKEESLEEVLADINEEPQEITLDFESKEALKNLEKYNVLLKLK